MKSTPDIIHVFVLSVLRYPHSNSCINHHCNSGYSSVLRIYNTELHFVKGVVAICGRLQGEQYKIMLAKHKELKQLTKTKIDPFHWWGSHTATEVFLAVGRHPLV